MLFRVSHTTDGALEDGALGDGGVLQSLLRKRDLKRPPLGELPQAFAPYARDVIYSFAPKRADHGIPNEFVRVIRAFVESIDAQQVDKGIARLEETPAPLQLRPLLLSQILDRNPLETQVDEQMRAGANALASAGFGAELTRRLAPFGTWIEEHANRLSSPRGFASGSYLDLDALGDVLHGEQAAAAHELGPSDGLYSKFFHGLEAQFPAPPSFGQLSYWWRQGRGGFSPSARVLGSIQRFDVCPPVVSGFEFTVALLDGSPHLEVRPLYDWKLRYTVGFPESGLMEGAFLTVYSPDGRPQVTQVTPFSSSGPAS